MDNFDVRKYLTEQRLEEINQPPLNLDDTEVIAKALANHLSQMDGVKYTVNAETFGESSFDLDLPGEPFDGGSYYISNEGGKLSLINAALPDQPVYAHIDPNNISNIKFLDQNIDQESPVQESSYKPSNKMKKSELKEMIRQALSEGDDKQTEKQAWWDKNKSTMQNLFGVDSFKELMMALGSASSTQVHKEGEIKEGVWSVLPARIPEFIQAVEDLKDEYHGVVGSDAVYDGLDAAIMAAKELLMNTAEVGDMPGFEGTMDDLDSLSIREAEEDEEEVDIDMPGFEGTMDDLDSLSIREAEEDEEEVDIDIDAEEDEELEDIEPETIPTAGLTGEMKEISDALEAALENARDLGDEKLVNQIGNTITYFTRAHVVKGGEEIGIEEGKEDGSKWFSKLDYLDSKGYNPARFNLMLKKHYGFKGSDEEAKVIVNQWKNSKK